MTHGRVLGIATPLVVWWLAITAATIAITWACRQVTDGALDCGRYGPRDCFWGAIAALNGLAVLPADMRSEQSARAVARLANALLDAPYDFEGERRGAVPPPGSLPEVPSFFPAYARVRGLGVACVTYSVGGLNCANAIAGAYAEKSPVLVPGLHRTVALLLAVPTVLIVAGRARNELGRHRPKWGPVVVAPRKPRPRRVPTVVPKSRRPGTIARRVSTRSWCAALESNQEPND
jgi:hypothetical protein